MVELSSQHWRFVLRMEKSDDASVSAGCSITATEARHDRYSFGAKRGAETKRFVTVVRENPIAWTRRQRYLPTRLQTLLTDLLAYHNELHPVKVQ